MNPAAVVLSTDGRILITATPDDTRAWSQRPGRNWPCSTIAGHRVTLSLDANGDMLDLVCGAPDVDSWELSAFCDDMLTLAARYLISMRRNPEVPNEEVLSREW